MSARYSGPMTPAFPVRAITLDLDDTLWPIAPLIGKAEAALDAWLRAHAPRTAARWPMPAMRALRDRIAREHPHLAHDFTTQRLLSLREALRDAGDDEALAEGAFEAFFSARCDVVHYDDTIAALERLAARVPLAGLSNGNACLERVGVMHLFDFQLGAREHGAAKPDPGIFLAACRRLGIAPAQVLHVGDDIEMDVVGAHGAGLRSCWLARDDHADAPRAWPHADLGPDITVPTLTALADWLDANASKDTVAA